jgi:glycogen synthase
VIRPLYKLNQHGFNTQRYHKDLFYQNDELPSDDHGKDMYRLWADFLSTGLLAADVITSVGTEIVQKVLNGDLVRIGAMSEKMRVMIKYRVNRGESEIVPNEPSRQSDPEVSPLLKIKYGTKDIMEGKARNKLEVQKTLHLDENSHIPMFSWTNRLQVLNKRADIFLGILEDIIYYYASVHNERPQFVIVANGERDMINWGNYLQSKYPSQVSIRPFDLELEESVVAASDSNIFASGYENRGRLNILGSRYGNWPIVSPGVEGVHSFDHDQINGNGWRYEHCNGDGLKYGINEAMKFQRQPFEYREKHLQRAREQNLEEHHVDNMINRQLDVWTRMLGHKLRKEHRKWYILF